MTTKFLDIKFALSIFYCRGVSQEKQHLGTIVLSAPKAPPLRNANFIFIVVSPSLSFTKGQIRP